MSIDHNIAPAWSCVEMNILLLVDLPSDHAPTRECGAQVGVGGGLGLLDPRLVKEFLVEALQGFGGALAPDSSSR